MQKYDGGISKDSSSVENYERDTINRIAKHFGINKKLHIVKMYSVIKQDDIKEKLDLLCLIVDKTEKHMIMRMIIALCVIVFAILDFIFNFPAIISFHVFIIAVVNYLISQK